MKKNKTDKKGTKKGAIELSMTTIIVIVLGVTLLILGLTWVRGMFEKVTLLTDNAFADAEKEIQNKMGPNEKFYVSGMKFALDSGKSNVISVGVQNFGAEETTNNFEIKASSEREGCDEEKWFVLPDKFELVAGDRVGVPVGITVPKGTEPKTICTFTISAYKDDKIYGSQPIIVEIKE